MEHDHGLTAYLSESSVSRACAAPTPNQEFSITDACIDKIDEPMSYEEFFLRYLVPNRPCIFGAFLTEGWPSRTDWVADDGGPDIGFLSQHFGDVNVPVANCERVQYDAQPKEDMPLRDYLRYWEEHRKQGQGSVGPCLYMKDMHFTRDCSTYKAYETPVYFTSDWLNEFWDTRTDCDRDDYRFVYMGPKGSWTPFHADVFRSYSWSANVCGSKRWILVPPGQEELLKDRLGNLPYDVTSCNFADSGEYPNFKEVSFTPIEVIQSAGEVMFVPSGWHHQVFNLEDTISINHNWFNGTSISRSWAFLQGELSEVERSISDCRDMEGWHNQCQLILKASSGMAYQEFFQLLVSVARRRLEVIRRSLDGTSETPPGGSGKPTRTDGTHPNSGTEYIETHDSSSYLVSSREMSTVVVCDDAEGEKRAVGGVGSSEGTARMVKPHPDNRAYCHNSHDLLSSHVPRNEDGVKWDAVACNNVGIEGTTRSDAVEHTKPPKTDSDDLSGGVESHDLSGGAHYWGRSLSCHWHAVFDLRQVVTVLEKLRSDPDCRLPETSSKSQAPEELRGEIEDTLSRVKLSSGTIQVD